MQEQTGARLKALDGSTLALTSVALEGDLRGPLFEGTIQQRFANTSNRNAEVVYTFPLPWGAVLLGVDVQLGSKRLSGIVIEKRAAEGEYEQAMADGDAAVMLERSPDGSYSLNLGNLLAGEACVVTLRYAQILQLEQGGLRLMIPTTLAPRYGDALTPSSLQPHHAVAARLDVAYSFELTLRLHGDLSSARVASPSHAVSVAYSSRDSGNVTSVALVKRGWLDRDFVLLVDQLQQDSLALVAADPVKPESFAVMACLRPAQQPPADKRVALKVLVDCSGSMAGDSIDSTRLALSAVVEQLGAQDGLSLSRFGSTVEHQSKFVAHASPAVQAAARRWVAGLQADMGGTDMETALASVFSLAHEVPCDVLLLTDGHIEGIETLIDTARRSLHRVFVVGIGSSPAESHLRRLAMATGGASEFVAPGESVEPAVCRMAARLRAPSMGGVSLAWPDDVAPTWVSTLPISIFGGDTVCVFAGLPGPCTGELRLIAIPQGQVVPRTLARASLLESQGSSDALPRMAAHNRSMHLHDIGKTVSEAESLQVALDYQLITDQTNFLLVHRRSEADRPSAMPELHQVAPMLAAGWGGVGSVMASLSRGRNVFETRVIQYSLTGALDWNEASFCQSADPAPSEAKAMLPSIDWRDSLLRSADGLTPRGLIAWLCSTPAADRPTSYAGLLEIGVSPGVVEWLRVSFELEANVESEKSVVRAFLDAMVTMIERLGIGPEVRGDTHGVLATPTVSELNAAVLAALSGMTAQDWGFAALQAPARERAGVTEVAE